MQNDNVISMVDRLVAKLAAESSSPLVHIQPGREESDDDFVDRIGSVIAALLNADAANDRT